MDTPVESQVPLLCCRCKMSLSSAPEKTSVYNGSTTLAQSLPLQMGGADATDDLPERCAIDAEPDEPIQANDMDVCYSQGDIIEQTPDAAEAQEANKAAVSTSQLAEGCGMETASAGTMATYGAAQYVQDSTAASLGVVPQAPAANSMGSSSGHTEDIAQRPDANPAHVPHEPSTVTPQSSEAQAVVPVSEGTVDACMGAQGLQDSQAPAGIVQEDPAEKPCGLEALREYDDISSEVVEPPSVENVEDGGLAAGVQQMSMVNPSTGDAILAVED